jgi:DNA-binding transcriptional LysR family regulator
METFIRVVETGSFSAAAKHLNVGQPAVSKSVAQLEARLGVRLLIRSTRRLVPTEAGRNFCERARRAIEQADEADHAARDAAAGFAGRLRISAPVTFARLHVVPRLPLFLAAHPNLSVDLVLDDRVVNLAEEGVDIALRMGTLRDSSLTARKIGSSRRQVVGAPGYFERAGIPTAPAKLSTHNAVVYIQNGIGDRWTFRRHGSEASVRISGRLRVSGLLKEDLDYHLIRASMVIMFLFFGYQKWFEYEAQVLIPYISSGPLISWMYPVFGVRGASWFLGVSEWLFGALLFLGFWDKRLGILGALGSCVTFLMTVTIIPFMPGGWAASAGGFPAMTGNVPFLMKDIVLFAASVYLLKQDVMRVSLSAPRHEISSWRQA